MLTGTTGTDLLIGRAGDDTLVGGLGSVCSRPSSPSDCHEAACSIRVLAPDVIGKVRIERIRASKTTRELLCMRPGATKPSKCELS